MFYTGLEDYGMDDEDFKRIINVFEDDENQNVSRRYPTDKSAMEKLVSVELNCKANCEMGILCYICQE